MTAGDEILADSAEDLFEHAPCGYLFTDPEGTIVKVNATFERWTGHARESLVARRRFTDLLTAGGRIYHETHVAPLLHMQGSAQQIAVDVVRADGSRLPALVNSVLHRDEAGRPRVIRTTVFDATDRRRYEEELLAARRREQEIAQRLQASLLSGALPEAAGLELEVAYRPAVRGLDVGGDWYDAFWLEEGETVGLVVGDVVGRGIEAAAAMGQLRSAIRALALTGLAPGALLSALDGYARRHAVGGTATVVYAELALRERRLRFACAGHPPPAVVEAGARPAFAWDGRSLPLDVYGSARGSRPEGERDLAPGATVVLYTDGLVERRTAPLDVGLERLLGSLDTHGRGPARVLADRVTRDLRDAEHPDDVCLLAARLAV